VTCPRGVLDVGQFVNAVRDGRWISFAESFFSRLAIARTCPSWLNLSVEMAVVRFSIVFSGVGCDVNEVSVEEGAAKESAA